VDLLSEMEKPQKAAVRSEFTASVLTAYARAVYRMAKDGKRGAISVFDVPVGLLSQLDAATLRHDYL